MTAAGDTNRTQQDEAALRTRYRGEMQELADRFCQERGYVLTNGDQTIEDFVSMRMQKGKFFCPCQPTNTDETICVCPPVLNGLVDFEGTCFCNFFSLPEGKRPIKDEILDET